MDELSKMEGNIYTVKMLDVILPVNKPEDLQSFQFMFIVMEYIELDVLTMFSRITPEDFTEKHVLHIMYNTLCCLNFLETANVLHRDLKPNNLLITDECTVMICDFGLARSKPIEPEESLSCRISGNSRRGRSRRGRTVSRSRPHSPVRTEMRQSRFELSRREISKLRTPRELTPHISSRWYRPPEIILGQNDYSFQVDVWSIGCTMAECIRMTDKYRSLNEECIAKNHNKRCLFTGTSCYPLSPVKNTMDRSTSKIKISKND